MKNNEIDMKTLVGSKFGDLSDGDKVTVLSKYTGIYFGTENGIEVEKPTKIGEYECTIDFEDSISIPGRYIVTENESYCIVDNECVFYKTNE